MNIFKLFNQHLKKLHCFFTLFLMDSIWRFLASCAFGDENEWEKMIDDAGKQVVLKLKNIKECIICVKKCVKKMCQEMCQEVCREVCQEVCQEVCHEVCVKKYVKNVRIDTA